MPEGRGQSAQGFDWGWLDVGMTGWADVESRSMFGGKAYLVRGRLFAAVTPMGLLLRLPPEEREALVARGRARTLAPAAGFSPGQWLALLPEGWETETQELLSLVLASYRSAQAPSAPASPSREARRFRKRQF